MQDLKTDKVQEEREDMKMSPKVVVRTCVLKFE